MNKFQSTGRRNNHHAHTSDIDDMDALLDHIDEFSQFVKSHDSLPDDQLQEEWLLFKTYLQWRIEDLTKDSYLFPLPTHKHNS